MDDATQMIEGLLQAFDGDPFHIGVTASFYDEVTGQTGHVGRGEIEPRTPYFATGTTKLYVTAIVMQMVAEGKLDLDAPFKSFMPDCKICVELHVMDGEDYTDEITLRQLMSHQSGLGDFFLYKRNARSFQHVIADGVDTSWDFMDVVMRTRSHGAIARPGSSRKALYTDSNFQLMGKVIEVVEGKNFGEVFAERVAARLGLQSTYLYSDPSDKRPADLMSGTKQIHVPLSMVSFQADGGIVTTSREALLFLRAFFEGYLFPKDLLPQLFTWRPMYFPTEFGTGLMRVRVPWWMTVPHRLKEPRHMFRKTPVVYGHVGLGGTFLFYAPHEGVYVTGTVNQMREPARAIKLVMQAVEAVVDARGETAPAPARAFPAE